MQLGLAVGSAVERGRDKTEQNRAARKTLRQREASRDRRSKYTRDREKERECVWGQVQQGGSGVCHKYDDTYTTQKGSFYIPRGLNRTSCFQPCWAILDFCNAAFQALSSGLRF